MAIPIPSRKVILPAVVTVRGGEASKLPVRVLRTDPSTPARLDVRGLPRGMNADGPAILPSGTETAEVVLSASAETTPGAAEVAVAFAAGAERGEAGLKVVVLPSHAHAAFEHGRAEIARRATRGRSRRSTKRSASTPAHSGPTSIGESPTTTRDATGRPSATSRPPSGPGPTPPMPTRPAALARIDLGEHRLALDDYTRAIELRAEARTYLARGCLGHDLGAYDEALADFDNALRLGPDDPRRTTGAA